jgi:hypothetical protein
LPAERNSSFDRLDASLRTMHVHVRQPYAEPPGRRAAPTRGNAASPC